jgi:hypothetical protein
MFGIKSGNSDIKLFIFVEKNILLKKKVKPSSWKWNGILKIEDKYKFFKGILENLQDIEEFIIIF